MRSLILLKLPPPLLIPRLLRTLPTVGKGALATRLSSSYTFESDITDRLFSVEEESSADAEDKQDNGKRS